MDIFTTQLAQVVQRPIKPTDFKVKALLKESASSKLSQDSDHLENHKYYLKSEDKEHQQKRERSLKEPNKINDEVNESHDENSEEQVDNHNITETHSIEEITYEKHGSEVNIEKNNEDEDDDTKHLDLYA
ncbi:hypothetical protein [Colwellia sp. E2M01]|uniref:hypothetical protein n=1 Tax=Colwellia sp. E2M01 TaxID=2841561 RepID=UPI001C09D187|nr:hypothetical protein [Colwellia sp. E2M01]MBU2872271.1 hypothetical protein [Colwellia sp. E2M01]